MPDTFFLLLLSCLSSGLYFHYIISLLFNSVGNRICAGSITQLVCNLAWRLFDKLANRAEVCRKTYTRWSLGPKEGESQAMDRCVT